MIENVAVAENYWYSMQVGLALKIDEKREFYYYLIDSITLSVVTRALVFSCPAFIPFQYF